MSVIPYDLFNIPTLTEVNLWYSMISVNDSFVDQNGEFIDWSQITTFEYTDGIQVYMQETPLCDAFTADSTSVPSALATFLTETNACQVNIKLFLDRTCL